MARSILLILCMGMALASGLFQFINAKDKHLSATVCKTCHLAGDQATPANAYQLIDTQEHLCASCHADALAVSHPSGFQAARMLPAEYPVDWKGHVTCSTCHIVHGDSHSLMRGNKFGKDLCLSCHDMDFFYQMADGGVSLLNGVHLAQLPNSTMTDLIDSYSQHCISCHQDYVGSAPNTITGENDYLLAHDGSTMPHPIGFQYDGTRDRYKDQHSLSDKIALPDGKLSCVSCHQAYDEGHGALVMPNNGSALCYQCHDI